MNLRDLRYLVAVDESRNFSHAAEKCHVSQPTLSNQIKKLEETLGIQVFTRNNKHVTPTETGVKILDAARRILREAEALHVIAESVRDPLAGKFRLGAFPTLATYLFPHLVPRVRDTLPELTLILVEEKTARLTEQLRNGELDAAFLALPVFEDQLVCHKLFDDPFLLAVSSQHPLTHRKRIRQRELEHHRLLLLEEGHCLRDQALEVCQMGGGAVEEFRATGLETLRQMVKAGTGITIMPRIAIQKNETGICYIPFDAPAPQRTIGLVWRKNCARMAVIDALIELATPQENPDEPA